MNKRYLIGIAVIVVCGAVGFTAFQGSLTPYVGFAEARAADRAVQIMGEIDKSQVQYDVAGGTLYFTIADEEGVTMPVAYKGVKPGNFDQANSVVAKGRYLDGSFHANQLLVKCPSKYQGFEAEGEENPHEATPPTTGSNAG